MAGVWQWNNVRFKYANPVAGSFGEETVVTKLFTYVKIKYALIESLKIYVNNSFLGPYTEIDVKSVTYDKPFKA